jgi:hypothetical protein
MNLKLRKYNSNISFLDTFLLTLIGITAILAVVIKLINPIADTGKIDPVTELMLRLDWDPADYPDLDIHVKTPNKDIISYRHKENGWMVLDRDDLGSTNDTYTINDEILVVKKNMEVININAIVPGEYVVNVHYYNCLSCLKKQGQSSTVQLRSIHDPIDYTVELIDMHPFRVMAQISMSDLKYRQEHTVITFVVDEEGNVKDIRTDIHIPLVPDKVGQL